mmetsp:Transcript_56160/g.149898  ORF Transcript_56160/g.149898 Transcript_56160/m.149898 type:complete len:97 (+) Transcript_56160:480-770(+)
MASHASFCAGSVQAALFSDAISISHDFPGRFRSGLRCGSVPSVKVGVVCSDGSEVVALAALPIHSVRVNAPCLESLVALQVARQHRGTEQLTLVTT